MPLVKAGHIVEDRFVRVLDDAPVPDGAAALLPAARFLADARDLVLRQRSNSGSCAAFFSSSGMCGSFSYTG